mgnify:CR=1 FL=1
MVGGRELLCNNVSTDIIWFIATLKVECRKHNCAVGRQRPQQRINAERQCDIGIQGERIRKVYFSIFGSTVDHLCLKIEGLITEMLRIVLKAHFSS